ncbi:MAG: hypothetical protein QM755_05000 [Luteolibacter sp.]
MKFLCLIPIVVGSYVSSAGGAVIIQELFDNLGADLALNGQAASGSSVGLSGTWATNGSTGTILTARNFNVDGASLPGLASNAGSQGGVYRGGGNNYGTNIYATIPLASSIDFSTTATLYFSIRVRNHGDSSMGVGLASGSSSASEFVGAGLTWNSATSLAGTAAGNAAYVTYGTLGQDLTGNNDGPYAIRASEAANSVNGYALLVGRITINPSGNDVLDLKRYAENATIDADLATINWFTSTSFDSSMNATQLLIWMNGSGGGELDAIRFGTTWQDVTGVAAVPEPSGAVLAAAALLGSALRRRR